MEEIKLVVKTGILGMIQEKNGVVKPEIGWFITDKIDIDQAQRKLKYGL